MKAKLAANSNIVSARVKPHIKKKIEAIAKAKERNVSYVVSQILTEHFTKCA